MDVKDREGNEQYRAPRANFTMRDFDIVGRLGDGSFSTVVLCKHRTTGASHAVKIVNKHLIMRNKSVDYIRNERAILDALDHDGIVKLCFTFQDPDSLYFGMEYLPGGDLYEQIEKRGKLDLADAVFYAAEVVEVLEYLRTRQVVHRDLKPENLLIAENGHIKLSDFGSAKAFFLPPVGGTGRSARATSFVGTAEYVSPEVLNNFPLSYPADLWALGCIIFQMLAGKPPFKAASEYLTFQLVSECDYEFPPDFPQGPARDVVDKLLQVDPDARLGAESLDDLKSHEFFSGINWACLRSMQAPDYIPPPTPSPEEEALDWELTSLVREHMGPLVVEGAHGEGQPRQAMPSATNGVGVGAPGGGYTNGLRGPSGGGGEDEGGIVYDRNPARASVDGSDSD